MDKAVLALKAANRAQKPSTSRATGPVPKISIRPVGPKPPIRPQNAGGRPAPRPTIGFHTIVKQAQKQNTPQHSARRDSKGSNSSQSSSSRTCQRIVKVLGLKHFALMLVLILYGCLGGAIFMWLELDTEKENRRKTFENLNASAWQLAKNILNSTAVKDYSGNKDDSTGLLELVELIKDYQVSSGQLDAVDNNDTHKYNFDFFGSFFYAGTVATTIGYGHYAPATTGGRIATMIYAIFGIPLVLATLQDLGSFLTRRLKTLYTFASKPFRTLWRRRVAKKQFDQNQEEEEEKEWREWEESETFDVPILVALGFIVGWICFCAGVFMLWEDWDYFTSFYFFFVSLSTIGLGDVTPDHPRYMSVGFIFVLFGLALVSVMINVIQNRLMQLKEVTEDFLEDEILGWDTLSESDSSDEDVGTSPMDSGRPAVAALGVLQAWKSGARRRRRGTQTTDSYVRQLKKTYPEKPYLEVCESVVRSRDDLDSLIDSLNV